MLKEVLKEKLAILTKVNFPYIPLSFFIFQNPFIIFPLINFALYFPPIFNIPSPKPNHQSRQLNKKEALKAKKAIHSKVQIKHGPQAFKKARKEPNKKFLQNQKTKAKLLSHHEPPTKIDRNIFEHIYTINGRHVRRSLQTQPRRHLHGDHHDERPQQSDAGRLRRPWNGRSQGFQLFENYLNKYKNL